MTLRQTAAASVALAVGMLGLVSATVAERADAGLIPPLTPPKPQPAPAPPPPPPPPPPTLRRGDNNADVRAVEQRLKDLAYDPGAIDGAFDVRTQFAVVSFQKVHGLATTTEVDPPTRRALANPRAPPVLQSNLGKDRVEVDIGMQLMTIYRNGRPVLISHISSGNEKRYCVDGRCEVAHTPRGNFAIGRMVKGWEKSRLGSLYNSAYFRGGYALHGSKSVPMHPASHGCVRVPMHTAEWFQRMLYRGIRVHVGGG